MQFGKLSFKAAILVLIGTASSMAAGIEPLSFGGTTVSDVDNWNYLLNYKMWGQEGISFGNNNMFETAAGWVGSAKNLTSTGNDARIAGAIIVGGKADNTGKMSFTTGPVRTGSGITDASRASGVTCSGTNTSGSCADVPLYKTDLTVPTLNKPANNHSNISVGDHGTTTVDLSNGPYDLYIDSFSMGQEATVIIKMPKGQPVRIFTKSFTTSTHSNIVVQYTGENFYRCNSKTTEFRCGGEYEGNLLFYVDGDVTFANVDYHPIVGTIISTGTMNIICNMSFAGQLLAKKLTIGHEVKGDGFKYVPFRVVPKIILSQKNATFKEDNKLHEIGIALNSTEGEGDVTFNYCFEFNNKSVPGEFAEKADVTIDNTYDFPICGSGNDIKVTIKKGDLVSQQKIQIKPFIDGVVEKPATPGEKLWLVIKDVKGAEVSKDNYDETRNGFNIFITDSDELPSVSSALKFDVDEDSKHTFTKDEFKFVHSTRTFASVKIVTTPDKGSLLLNGTTVTRGQTITVANLTKLTYAPAANDFGNNYTTFKYQVVGSGSGDNTSIEYAATVNVIPVNDKPSSADVVFTVGEQSHIVSGGPIEAIDVSNERNIDTYSYTIVEASGSDYADFNRAFEIVKNSDQNATIQVKKNVTLDYNKKNLYIVYAKISDNAATENQKVKGPLTSAQFKITVKISDEPEIIAQPTSISPLEFKKANGSTIPTTQAIDNWNYLLNYKMWGQTEISFGNNNMFETAAGWVGSANNLTSTGNDARIAGAIIVGGKADNTGKMAFTTGPVRAGQGITDAGRVSGTICQGTNTSGSCADVPLYKTDLTVPTLNKPANNHSNISVGDHGTSAIDLSNGPYDLYIDSFNMGQEATVIIKMPKGQPVRIFTKSFTTRTHPNIVVQYTGENFYRCNSKTSEFKCGDEYEGNLLIYVDGDVTFANVDYHPIVGTIVSTGTINVICNMSFAGQFLAKTFIVGNEVKGDGFKYVPFRTQPQLSIRGSNANKFVENDTWQAVNVALSEEANEDVSFEYCFDFYSENGIAGKYAGYSDVGKADASHNFPICDKNESAKATILKGQIQASGIYIKPLVDALSEKDEALWLRILNLKGATLSSDYDNGHGFELYIESAERAPIVSKELVISVNEDETHSFTAAEFEFQDESQTFAAVAITTLPDKGSLLLNGKAIAKGTAIAVADLAKLTYQPAANEFGNSYTTFKYQVIGSGDKYNTSEEYTATVNVISVNDKPTVANVEFTVSEQSHIVQGGPINVDDVSNERNKDTYSYALVNVSGSDYSEFSSLFEIVKTSDQNATIQVKKNAVLDYNKKSQYVVYATVTDDAATENQKVKGSLTSDQFKITVKISDEPEIIVQNDISPLEFKNAASAQQASEYWNYLLNYKMWGQEGISFGNNNMFETAAGWVGSAKNLTSTGNDAKIAGAIIVGGKADNTGKMSFTTGPVRTGSGITNPGWVSGTVCQGTDISGNCADVPLYKTDLTIPTLNKPANNYNNISVMDHGTTTIDLSNGPYDLYIDSFNIEQDATVIFRMPAGQPVRIFTKSFTTSTHPNIVVQYTGEDFQRCTSNYTSMFKCGGEYEGNLLIYVDSDVTFKNLDYHPIVGTFVSTGTINVIDNMSFAGQLLAKTLTIGHGVKGDGFKYVPFSTQPSLGILGKDANKFVENDTWQAVNVALTAEAKSDITFSYCFAFKSETGTTGVYAGYDDVGKADASHNFPICGKGESAEATIPAGKKQATGINIKPLTDGLVENEEKLWLTITNLQGAELSQDYDQNYGFPLYIVNRTEPNEAPTKPALATEYFVDENSKAGTAVGTFEVFDDDKISGSFETLTYTLTGSDIFEVKEVGNKNGTRTVSIDVKDASLLDYEALYNASTKNATYPVTITIKDEAGNTTTAATSITIRDVNEAPHATGGTFTLKENSPIGSPVCVQYDKNGNCKSASIQASDPDIYSTAFSTLTYKRSANNTGDMANDAINFTIDQNGQLFSNADFDYETDKRTYTFLVAVYDGTNSIDVKVTVNIEDVEEQLVVVNADGETVINGNAATGTTICDATQNNDESTQAQLNEIANEITYTMSEGTTESTAELFDVNAQSGNIAAKTDLVFEALYPNNEFTIVVNASGTNANDEPVSTNITKKVIVADVNEKPIIKNDEPIAISETAFSNGGVIGKIEAIDPDSCSFNPAYACKNGTHPLGFNKLHYEIDEILEVDGSTDFPFEIDPNTGEIRIKQEPQFVKRNGTNAIKKAKGYSGLKQGTYEFIVKVTDSSEDPLSVKKKIVIEIKPLITFKTINGINTAILDGEYKINSETNIQETYVDSVVFERTWTPDAYSTLTLPFSINVDNIEGIASLLKFNGLGQKNENGQEIWYVSMAKLWETGNDGVTIEAYKPYMILMESEKMIIHSQQAIKIEEPANAKTIEEIDGWQFKGTLTYKQWTDEDPELGLAYGFAAEAKDDISIGQFVKAGVGAWISPFRAYLLNKSSANKIKSNYTGAKVSTMKLPDVIDIVIDDEAEEKTTVIGKFNTRTGEIHMNTAKQTYDLKGRNVGNKANKARGAYYGKKVVK